MIELLRLLWQGGMKFHGGQPWNLEVWVGFPAPLIAWSTAAKDESLFTHYLLTRLFQNTTVLGTAKLILSAEKPNCTPRGYGSINDFTCLPVLFPLHTQSNPAPNCSVVSSAELIWEERMLSYVEGPTLEIESTHGVGQHKLIYPFEINTLILINFPKDLFADKLLSPVLMLSRWQAGKHLREDVNN